LPFEQQQAPQVTAYAPVEPDAGPAAEVPARFQRQVVAYATAEPPGTVIIDTPNTYLYLVLGNGRALRYGIGVGREASPGRPSSTSSARPNGRTGIRRRTCWSASRICRA
jgi:lipoprotein-anchoring transpeptidase ErfK/SrfK